MLSFAVLLAAMQPANCPTVPAPKLLTLDYEQFDTFAGDVAWRSLLSRGCVDAAVATLAAFVRANASSMSDAQVTELHFHMGQALTMSDRNAESIPHFQRAVSPQSTADWSAYVQAHLGFARKDRDQIEQALAAFEKIATPGSMRLNVVRGLLNCLDKPYMEAAHCSM